MPAELGDHAALSSATSQQPAQLGGSEMSYSWVCASSKEMANKLPVFGWLRSTLRALRRLFLGGELARAERFERCCQSAHQKNHSEGKLGPSEDSKSFPADFCETRIKLTKLKHKLSNFFHPIGPIHFPLTSVVVEMGSWIWKTVNSEPQPCFTGEPVLLCSSWCCQGRSTWKTDTGDLVL